MLIADLSKLDSFNNEARTELSDADDADCYKDKFHPVWLKQQLNWHC